MTALNDFGRLDSVRTETFESVTPMTSRVFKASIATVSLTGPDREGFKSRVRRETEIPGNKTPYAEVARLGDLLVISSLLAVEGSCAFLKRAGYHKTQRSPSSRPVFAEEFAILVRLHHVTLFRHASI